MHNGKLCIVLRRQRVESRYIIEELPICNADIVIGVELNGVRYDRVGNRVELRGRGKFQLECPESPEEDLLFVPHADTGGSAIRMSPERANVLAADGQLIPLDN